MFFYKNCQRFRLKHQDLQMFGPELSKREQFSLT